MKIFAPAKINLFLEVISKRGDGYHNIETLIAPVTLFDEIEVFLEGKNIEVICDLKALSGAQNLVYKSAFFLKSLFPSKIKGLKVFIKKNIPVAAGLGGGSSDCAALMKLLNTECGLGLSNGKLKKIGAKFGADIPFFVDTESAVCHGKGDILKPFKINVKMHFLLVNPNVTLSTAESYANLKTFLTADNKSINILLRSLKNNDIENSAKNMFNRLQGFCEKKIPFVTEIINVLYKNSALKAMVSGSGPTVFGLYRTASDAQRAKKSILEHYGSKISIFIVESF
ncbi:MAG: 4-(cytidine 5'-diphospho)-2-C-methyl-D-erythritol kinase [bacterium]|nr:4-(cytidine 5'-diphospho)-2-C-methyl-D-erythritol kinase [bacterium]